MECSYCKGECVKIGVRNQLQRYRCKACKKHQQKAYTRPRIQEKKYEYVKLLNNEGCGISSIGRLLHISKSSVQRVIMRMATTTPLPEYKEENQSYEVDELRVYCGNKQNECWLTYAISKKNGKVAAFFVGRRTKENLYKVVEKVLSLKPKHIYTDGLAIYKTLITPSIHQVFARCTNKIERMNLTLRTHLKRLNRKSICFTRSKEMLRACIFLYFSSKLVKTAR